MNKKNIRDIIKESAAKKILFLPHAIRQMSRIDRMIGIHEIREIIERGELIEDYPEDARGHSCLICGISNVEKRPLHIVCSPKVDYLAIITAYVPHADDWTDGFRKRRRQ